MDVVALLARHLSLLDFAYSLVREENDDLCSRNIAEAFESGLACVSRCGCQDADLLVFILFFDGCREKVRQNRKSHVFECRCPSVVQLEEVSAARLYDRDYVLSFELVCVSAVNTVLYLFICIIVKESSDDSFGYVLVFRVRHLARFERKSRYAVRDIKTSVFCHSHDDCAGGRLFVFASSGALVCDHASLLIRYRFIIFHNSSSSTIRCRHCFIVGIASLSALLTIKFYQTERCFSIDSALFVFPFVPLFVIRRFMLFRYTLFTVPRDNSFSLSLFLRFFLHSETTVSPHRVFSISRDSCM